MSALSDMNEYQALALRTAGKIDLGIATLGLAGEAGEVADLVKKYLGHGHPLITDKLLEELGDVLWYIAAIASLNGHSLSYVANMNIEKLKRRYPDGFSEEASRNRT
jgi:NTP pyrophosphatase (non-canonical NTP hydrolase)